MRVKYAHPIKFYSFLIPCMLNTFPPRLLVNAGDLALTLTVTLFYVETRGSSKIWPWMYQPNYLLDKPSSEQPPPHHCAFQ